MKDVEVLIDDLAETGAFAIELGSGGIHVTIGIPNRLWLVVGTQRLVVEQTNRH